MNAPTTAGMIRHWAEVKPDHVALRWEGGEMTYRELDLRSSRVAQALRAEGVGPGERVAFLDKNAPGQVELFFGAAKLNAVPAPVNFRLAPPEVALIVSDTRAKVFVAGVEFRAATSEVSGTKVLAFGEEFAAWRDAHPAEDPGTPQNPGDVAYQLYSSGTTGRPKGVELMQSNLAAGLSLYPSLISLGGDSVSMVAMPLYHIGGGGWLLAGMSVGATNVLVRDIVPTDLVRLIEQERVTHAFIVPAVLQFMLSVPGVADRDFSSLHTFLYGASPISEKVLADSIRTFKCRFVQVYGLTESMGTVVMLPAADHDPDGPNRHRLRSVGLPAPGVEARVADPVTGDDVPRGQVGEIWVRGPMVMKGYWNMPEATAEVLRPGGWLRTGDAGYADADGYLYVHDRIKDMIVSGGENIYPAEVENVLMSHPAIADAAVIGVPDEKWGETPKAMVVRAPAAALTEQEVIAYCRERLAGFKCPTSVEWLQQLPRNASGKILKRDLRAPYWAGRDRMVG